MRYRRSGGSGCSFPVLLFLLFLVLRLTHVIDWSWWWVTAPLWLPAALALAGMLVLAITGVSIYKIVNAVFRRQVLRKGTGSGARPDAGSGGAAHGDVLDAEGTEVPVSAPEGSQTLSLPAAQETPPADGSTD